MKLEVIFEGWEQDRSNKAEGSSLMKLWRPQPFVISYQGKAMSLSRGVSLTHISYFLRTKNSHSAFLSHH